MADPGSASRLLDVLGLARRAGRLVVGTRAVREAAGGDELRLVAVAGDAGDNALGRLRPVLDRSGLTVVEVADRQSLGAALGRGPVVAVGLTDRGLAEEVRRLAERSGSDRRRTPAEDGPYQVAPQAGDPQGRRKVSPADAKTKSTHAS